MSQFASIAQALVHPGKGILAADESFPTIEKRFRAINVSSTEETRRDYREMLFATPGLADYISGVILFDETIRQKTRDGQPLVELLKGRGMIPGIKVDKGTTAIPGSPQEKVTEGLDGLRSRLAEYAQLGAKFSKWRAVIVIGDGFPSELCLRDNAHALGRFAALSQEAGLVPIVEPEVMMDGGHTIERCEEATGAALRFVFEELLRHRVRLEEMLLKPNMVLPGKDAPRKATRVEIAAATLRCFRRFIPPAVPGIVFLSGGQSDVEATWNLDAINRIDRAPWELSFSFGRALQAPALKAWAGRDSNIAQAQKVLLHRSRCNHKARFGEYTEGMESEAG